MLKQDLCCKDEEIASLKSKINELQKIANEKAIVVCEAEKNKREIRRAATEENRRKALAAKSAKAKDTAALILSHTIDGKSVEDIIEIWNDYYCSKVDKSTIYRAISVRKDGDRDRVLSLYHCFPDYFSNTSEQEVIDWFEKTRIKKLHLLEQEEFVKLYGEDLLPEPDKYISGGYYPVPKSK